MNTFDCIDMVPLTLIIIFALSEENYKNGCRKACIKQALTLVLFGILMMTVSHTKISSKMVLVIGIVLWIALTGVRFMLHKSMMRK